MNFHTHSRQLAAMQLSSQYRWVAPQREQKFASCWSLLPQPPQKDCSGTTTGKLGLTSSTADVVVALLAGELADCPWAAPFKNRRYSYPWYPQYA